MMDLFAEALTVLQRCECREDPVKDGCYRCVYAYRTSFDMPYISRRIAIQCLSEILDHRERLVPTDTITRISQSSFIESELEAYFIEALHRERYNDVPVQLRKDIVHHKTGWYCKVNEYGYYIEPQVELSASDGVPMATRPDFVIYPERQKLGRPIAVYLDGFAHHADTRDRTSRVGDDMAKHMGLVRSGHFHVWSLTWKDVESRFSGDSGYFAPVLPPMTPKQQRLLQSFDRDTAVGSIGDTNHLDSFALLVRVLGEPNQRAWQASAAIQMLVHLDMRGCDRDDIMLELERLLGEGAPWVVALSPTADARGLVKGTLADTDSAASARLELLTWVTTDAISRRALDAVEVVGVLHDVGDIDTAADFKRAWNGFLRLYNLLQFLPESLCVTAQGVQDNAYQALEFVRASPITASLGDEGCAVLSAYAALVDAEILEALRQLAAHGVRLPAPACIPFELCGLHGNIIGQAELAWDDGQIAFVYTDDTVSQQAFAHAGWTVRTVEELGAHPMAFIQGLKGGKN